MSEAGAPVYFNFASDVVDHWATTRPQSLALWHVHATTRAERKLTFREIAVLSRRAANFFRSYLYFTSATTGDAKMVLHTQATYGLGHRSTGELWLDLKPGELHWNISDLGWAKAAWSSLFGPWHMGACVFALETAGKFDPRLTLETLAQFPIRTWCAPPTALRLIVREDWSLRD